MRGVSDAWCKWALTISCVSTDITLTLPQTVNMVFFKLEREDILTISEGEPLLLLGHVLLLNILLPQSILLHRFTAVVDLLLARLRLPHSILQLELPVVTLNVLPYVLRVKRRLTDYIVRKCTLVDNKSHSALSYDLVIFRPIILISSWKASFSYNLGQNIVWWRCKPLSIWRTKIFNQHMS